MSDSKHSIGPRVMESKTLKWIVGGVSLGISIGSAVTFIKATYVTEKRASEIVGPVSQLGNDTAANFSKYKKEQADLRDEDRAFHRQLVLGLIRARAKASKKKIDVSQLLGKYDTELRAGQTETAALEHLLLELE